MAWFHVTCYRCRGDFLHTSAGPYCMHCAAPSIGHPRRRAAGAARCASAARGATGGARCRPGAAGQVGSSLGHSGRGCHAKSLPHLDLKKPTSPLDHPDRRLLPPRMAHTFEPRTRVRLVVQDFQDLGGLLFRSGQLATVQGHLDGTSLVHFDGYEELEEEFRVKPVALGAADQAPWLAAVPTELLEPI